MDVDAYADRAVALANADLADLAGAKTLVRDHLGVGPARRTTDDDLAVLQEVRADLRRVFGERDASRAAARLNRLLGARPVTPRLSADDGWHLEVTGDGVAGALLGPALYGLALAFAEHGPERLGVCADPDCGTVFLERNGGRPRRWCGERCATRSHVAAYRARQKTTARKTTAGTPTAQNRARQKATGRKARS